MEISEPQGVPFRHDSSEPINEWSREVFDALSSWASGLNGHWTRWDGDYLLLEIDRVGDETIEPILINTADEELTVEFGFWHTHLPEEAPDAEGAAQEAMALVAKWLSGELRTAVFTNDAGEWCGSMTIEPGEFSPPDGGGGMDYFKPTRVEVRGPRKQDWVSFAI